MAALARKPLYDFGSKEGLFDNARAEMAMNCGVSTVPDFAEQSASIVFKDLKLRKVISKVNALQIRVKG